MRVLTFIVTFVLVAATQVIVAPLATASDTDVVISEIHYKPASGDAEFVEIANPTNGDINIEGWTFSDAFDLVLPANSVVPANSRVIVTRSSSDFLQHLWLCRVGTVHFWIACQ